MQVGCFSRVVLTPEVSQPRAAAEASERTAKEVVTSGLLSCVAECLPSSSELKPAPQFCSGRLSRAGYNLCPGASSGLGGLRDTGESVALFPVTVHGHRGTCGCPGLKGEDAQNSSHPALAPYLAVARLCSGAALNRSHP